MRLPPELRDSVYNPSVDGEVENLDVKIIREPEGSQEMPEYDMDA